MESVLENQRRLHEERERLVDAIVHEFLHENKSNHRSVVNTQHRVKELVDRYHGDTSKLAELYEDADQSRQKELDAVAGPNEFAEFYSRLKALKDVHRRNPDEVAVPLSMEFQQMKEEVADPDRVEKETIPFTDEEGYGRYLDMHSLFANYLNLKGVRNIVTSKKGAQKESHIDYVTYVAIFDRFEDIPRDLAKKTGSYKEYLNDLKAYLVSFFERTRPLFDLKELFQRAADEVEANWETGKVPGWEKDPQSALNAAVALDLSPFANAQELEQLGGDRLKSALLALGLKTVKERAERLFATKGHKLSDLELSVLAKKNDTEEREKRRQKELAVLESEIRGMAVALREERDATKENIERKQARAVGEEDEEEEAEQIVEYEEEERDDSIPYNPKNLPLGWDGKPIPYWLYKLHGLNLSYECEICGNQVYKGPKAFQRHFTEWRHSHGMRCLGIPNTAHFANITKIADATELWQKMRLEKETSRWNPEVHEEFEDSAGNVVNKRTFEDLQRQGLL